MKAELQLNATGQCILCGENCPGKRHAGTKKCQQGQRARALKRTGFVPVPGRMSASLRVSGLMRYGWRSIGEGRSRHFWVPREALRTLTACEWIAWYIDCPTVRVARRVKGAGQEIIQELGRDVREARAERGRVLPVGSDARRSAMRLRGPAGFSARLLARIAGVFGGRFCWHGLRIYEDGRVEHRQEGKWVPVDKVARSARRALALLGAPYTDADLFVQHFRTKRGEG